MGRWETNFVLTQDAAKRFERYTEANIGNRAAIVVDGQVISAPTIQSQISDTGRITGAATQEEAADLALEPARRFAAGQRRISWKSEPSGPSLGADSIREGFRAGIAGVIAVVVCDAVLLPALRNQRHPGADPERGHSDRGAELFRRHADAARHRRHHS